MITVNPGKLNKLKVLKMVDFGLYLDGGEEWGEILLPRKEIPEYTIFKPKCKS